MTSLQDRAAELALASCSLEQMLTHPLMFGLETASAVQRAICRVAEGRPLDDLASDPAVLRSFGTLPGSYRPREMAIVAGIRTYKSGWCAAAAAHAAMQCDVTGMKAGERLRCSIVSTKLDNAKAVYGHLAGAFTNSPMLKSMLVSDPANSADRFLVRHPQGPTVELGTIAGSRAAGSLVSDWKGCVIFDEYARMLGDASEGVVNWKEQRAAVRLRIRPLGYLVHVSSPYAELGPAYDHVTNHWGKPSEDLVVVRAAAPDMNPVWWTPERCEEAKRDEDSYRTDVLAEFLSPEQALFPAPHIDQCIRETDADEPRDKRASYTAAMDPATRSNGWTFAIFTRDGSTRRMVCAREWMASRAKPLDPEQVFAEGIAPLCREYGVERIDSDQWSGDALAAIARRYGLDLDLVTQTDRQRTARYMHVRTMLARREVSLPRVVQIKADLLRIKRKISAGGVSISLPETSDGRHCDWAPTLVLGMARYADDMAPIEAPPPTDAEWAAAEVQRMREEAERQVRGDRWDD